MDINESKKIDKDSRKKIIKHTDKNFFVEAGAGSGKTFMLVNRMVAMVEQGIDIEKICAITFTKAAAGEFYKRFQARLIERSTDVTQEDNVLGEQDDKTKENCRKALEKIDLCFMGTIDSFCNTILMEHPYEAGIRPESVIATNSEIKSFYHRIYADICKGGYGEELAGFAAAFRNVHFDPDEVFVKAASYFIDRRNVRFEYERIENVNDDILHELDRGKKGVVEALDVVVKHPELKYETDSENMVEAWDKRYSALYNIRKSCTTNFADVLKGLNDIKKIRINIGALEKYEKALGDIFRTVKGNKKTEPSLKIKEEITDDDDGIYRKMKNYAYTISMNFILRCIPLLEKAMKDAGLLIFFDNLYYLRNMLKKDAEEGGTLIKYIRKRHQYFLIDEFQDTNPLQAEIFFYLSSDKPAAKWTECTPEPGSLFIVGDPKQSIYRFRCADVDSFMKVKTLFNKANCEVLYLTRNFRSGNKLCEYFNNVLKPVMEDNHEKYNDIYIDVPEDDKDKGFEGVYTYSKCKNDAAAIADIIEKMTGNEAFKIREKPGEELRLLNYGDFMVITKGKDKLPPILQELKGRKIGVKVEGAVPFKDSEVLAQVCAIFASVCDNKDNADLYKVLVGPIFGIAEGELTIYKNKVTLKGEKVEDIFKLALYPEVDKETLSNEAEKRIAECLERLRKFKIGNSSLTPSGLFAKIIDEFELFRFEETGDCEVVYYTLELLRDAERSGNVRSQADGNEFLKTLISGDTEIERCLSLNENVPRVHLANLHKVKGLESKVVILTNCAQGNFNPEDRIVYGGTKTGGHLFRLKESGSYITYFETNIYDTDEATKDEKAEQARQKYVAATRAENILIINNDEPLKGKSFWEPLWKGRGLEDINNVLVEDTGSDNRTGAQCAPERGLELKSDGESESSNIRTGAQCTPATESDGKPDTETGCKPDTESDGKTVMVAAAKAKSLSPRSGGHCPPDKMPDGATTEKTTADAASLYEEGKATCIFKDRKVEMPSYEIINPSLEKSKLPATKLETADDVNTLISEYMSDEDEINQEAPEKTKTSGDTLGDGLDSVLGTMVHKLMELLVLSGGKLSKKAMVSDVISECLKPENKENEKTFAKKLESVAGQMLDGGYKQENETESDIISVLRKADEVYCELPFTYKEEGEEGVGLINGVMDLVYRAGDKWYIVDYKTNADGTGLDEAYAAQLESYRKALKAIKGIEAQARVYHIAVK